jgi:zinc protease
LFYAFVVAPQSRAGEIDPVRFTLPNGLTVLVQEEHALPIVHLHALIGAGSAQDPPEKAGLANLAANLLDEGTKTRNARQIAEAIEFVGGSLAAKTGPDFTTAAAHVLTKDQDLGFTLLADILLHASFPPKELERVRSEILGEIQSEQDAPDVIASKAFHELVFDGHPYRWPVNGTERTLPKVRRADLLRFYAREYVPNRTILTIVGDLSLDQARAQAVKYFGAWKKGNPSARPNGQPKEVPRTVTRLIEKDLTQATIVLGHTGISRTNPDYYAVSVMNYILGGGGFSSRLMDSIRDNQGLAYGVFSVFHANRLPGPFTVTLQTRSEMAARAIDGVLAELKGMVDRPPTDEELNDAKAYLMGSFPLRFDTTAKLADIIAQVEFFGLGKEYYTDYPKWIERVTKEDIQRVAKQYLHPDRYALVVVGNQAKANIKP